MKMTGVTMCSGYNLQTKETCSKVDTCYRNKAIMSESQPIFVVPPFIEMPDGSHECEYYFQTECKKINDEY